MDSSGLAALISAHQLTQERRGRLALVITSESVRRTVEVRGLDRLFTIVPGRDEALAYVRPRLDVGLGLRRSRICSTASSTVGDHRHGASSSHDPQHAPDGRPLGHDHAQLLLTPAQALGEVEDEVHARAVEVGGGGEVDHQAERGVRDALGEPLAPTSRRVREVDLAGQARDDHVLAG